MSADTPLIETRQLARRYGAQTVFENVSLQVARGEFVAIVGESGVGKSTLLNCLAALDTWDAGQVLFDGTDLTPLDDTARALAARARGLRVPGVSCAAPFDRGAERGAAADAAGAP